MIAAMVNIRERMQSVLIVVIEKDNLDRMRTGDPATLESLQSGGVLVPPMFPLNLSMLIFYEEDDVELYTKAQGDPLEFLRWLERGRKFMFLRWLERGRKFIKGLDGKENTSSYKSKTTQINEKLLAAWIKEAEDAER